MAFWRVGRVTLTLMAIAIATVLAAAATRAQEPASAPAYTADGKMVFPKDYRTWIYLSSGLDMSYSQGGGMPGMSAFDNVFVDPEAYAAFQKTGTWPDKTVLVLEVRRGQQNGSINKRGRFQTDKLGAEIHVKDVARFKGGWAFFAFEGDGPGQLLPQSQPCYSCHEQHAAVDTTFVQFYPTLLPLAKDHKTLSANYLADEVAAKSAPAATH
jgi:hypothetical protein